MVPHLTLLLIFLFFSLLFTVGSGAVPACTFRTTCNPGETCIFEVLQENNTHVGSCDSPYTTKVCCTEIDSVAIRSSCNANEGGIISMYATSNSHAGRRDYYSNIVCARNTSTGNPVITNMRTSCLARENCAFTVFQENNTHAGRCGYYSTSVCLQENFNVTVTMILNTSEPNWRDWVMLSGVATRADGTSIDTSADPEDVEVFLNGTGICTTDTNSSGGYTCNFTAPVAVGLYELNVTVDDPTTGRTSWNSTRFTVKQLIGEPQVTAEKSSESIACYEEPRIVQNPDGTLEVAIVRICVFK